MCTETNEYANIETKKDPLDENIAKGTTDQRVEFISQVPHKS